jgi:nucleotide-binding universal stress UspA family protein
MQRFKKILVVIDPKTRNEALIDRAVTLSQRNNASLTVVTIAEDLSRNLPTTVELEQADIEEPGIDIIEELPTDISAPITSDTSDVMEVISDTPDTPFSEAGAPPTWNLPVVIQEQIDEAEDHHLDRIVTSIRLFGIQASSKVLHGTPFIEIIREVLRNEYDLVMITAESRSRLKEMLFGRTTMHLMRKCPCPVWVMNPAQPKHYNHILAAVDPNPSDQERSDLNIKIMDLATSLAQREQCELLVTHTWIFFLERYVQSGRVKVLKSTYDEWVHNFKDERRRSLNSLLGEYNLQKLKCQVYLLKGEAERLIPELAKAREVELIVMGTVCRTGLAGFLIGNTAEKVLRQVDCSVLTIKPDGFITPVKLDV